MTFLYNTFRTYLADPANQENAFTNDNILAEHFNYTIGRCIAYRDQPANTGDGLAIDQNTGLYEATYGFLEDQRFSLNSAGQTVAPNNGTVDTHPDLLIARDFDRLSRLLHVGNAVTCSSVSVVNGQLCIGINQYPRNTTGDNYTSQNYKDEYIRPRLEKLHNFFNTLNANMTDEQLEAACRAHYEHPGNKPGYNRGYQPIDIENDRPIQDLMKTTKIFLQVANNERPEYQFIRQAIQNSDDVVILNTSEGLHAELDIENYKDYIRTAAQNNPPVGFTSPATGVSILCCHACISHFQSKPNASIVTGGHKGNYLAPDPGPVKQIPIVNNNMYPLLQAGQLEEAMTMHPKGTLLMRRANIAPPKIIHLPPVETPVMAAPLSPRAGIPFPNPAPPPAHPVIGTPQSRMPAMDPYHRNR